MVECVETAKSC